MRYYLTIFFFITSLTASAQYYPLAPGTFNSTNDLHIRIGSDGSTANVSGLRGGPFIWSASSTAAPDSGTIFKVSGVTTGRWVRVYDPAAGIRPEWFGAVGDSITNSSTSYVKLGEFLLAHPESNIVQLANNVKYISTPFKWTGLKNLVIQGNGASINIKDTAVDYYAGVEIIGSAGGSYIINNLTVNNENAHSGTPSASNRWIGMRIAGATNVELIELISLSNCKIYGVGRSNGTDVSTNVNANCYELSAKNIVADKCFAYNAGYSGFRVSAINSKITNCSSFDTHQRDLSMMGQFMYLINAASPGATQVLTNFPVVLRDSVIFDYQNTKQHAYITAVVSSGSNYLVTFRPALTQSISTTVLNQPITGSIMINNFTGVHTDTTTDNAGGGLVLDGGANIFRSISIDGLTLNGPMASAGLKARNFIDFKVSHYNYSINYSKPSYNPYAMVADIGANGTIDLSSSNFYGAPSFMYARNVIINGVTVRGVDSTVIPGYGATTDYAFQIGEPNTNLVISNVIIDSTKFGFKHLNASGLQSVVANNVAFNPYVGSTGYFILYDTIPSIKTELFGIRNNSSQQYLINAGTGGNPWLYKLNGVYLAPTLPTLSQHGNFKVGDILVYNTGFANLISICTGAGNYSTATWQSLTPIKDGSIINIGTGYFRVNEGGHYEIWPKTDPAITARLLIGADSANLLYTQNATYSSGLRKFGFAWQYGGTERQRFTDLGAGFSITNPTALVHIGAGVLSKAPLRLQGGIAPGVPNNGDIWHDSTTAGLGFYARLNGATVKLNNDPFTRTDSLSVVNDSTLRVFQKYSDGNTATYDIQLRGGNHGGGGGTGTVTSVGSGYGLGGGPIVNSGTLFVDTTNSIASRARITKILDSMALVNSATYALATRSIGTGYGLTGGGTLAADRTLIADTFALQSRLRGIKIADSIQAVNAATYALLTTNMIAGVGLTGGGTLAANRTFNIDTTTTIASKAWVTNNFTGGGGGISTAQLTDSLNGNTIRNRTNSDPIQSASFNISGLAKSGNAQETNLQDSAAQYQLVVSSSGYHFRKAFAQDSLYNTVSVASLSAYTGGAIRAIVSGTGFSAVYRYDGASVATPNATTIVASALGGNWIGTITNMAMAGIIGNSPTAGRLLFVGTDGSLQSKSAFAVDSTNSRVLLNSASSTAFLNVRGTTAQAQFEYDGSNNMNLAVGSTGNATITLTGTAPVLILPQGIQMATSGTNGNLYVPNAAAMGSSSSTSFIFGTASTIQMRVSLGRGSTASTLTAGNSYSGLNTGDQVLTEAATSTHRILANTRIGGISGTNAAGATKFLTSLYVSAPSGVSNAITPDSASISIWTETAPRFDLATNALGDTYYRGAQGLMTPAAAGTDNQVLGYSSGIPVAVNAVKTGSSTQSGTGAATTFTIAHGLGNTPTYWVVQAANAATAGISYVTADATNLTVTYTVAPANGTNNLVFKWGAKL